MRGRRSATPGDLVAAERDVRERLARTQPPLQIDYAATSVVANVFRVASSARAVFERRVLAAHKLSFTAFTVLWVLWIWGEQEFRHVARESGITKGTLTGVLATLESRGLVARRRVERDRRLVLVSATEEASAMMAEVFPAINAEEASMVARLDVADQQRLASLLREVLRQVDGTDGEAEVEVGPDAVDGDGGVADAVEPVGEPV